jgi:hypothetical protein
VDLEIILDAEFFAEEDDPLALRNPEVMDCEDHCCCVLMAGLETMNEETATVMVIQLIESCSRVGSTQIWEMAGLTSIYQQHDAGLKMSIITTEMWKRNPTRVTDF